MIKKISIVLLICTMLSCAVYVPVHVEVPENCEKIGDVTDVNGVPSLEYICH